MSFQTPVFGQEPVVKSVHESPLVSIIISNYNYEHFLREAVDSALNQTYSNLEVIVVDDGSTDDSRKVIASYGDRIVPILKENGGQSSACNAGFRASKGEIAIFLDADDALLPDTVCRVVSAFRSRPGVAKVQYRHLLVDANGKPTGAIVPLVMESGDLRQQLLELSGYSWPSTSGNAFTTEALHWIMPIPENVYRGIPDIYLCNLSAVLGEVISLEKPGVLRKVHGMNNYYDPTVLIDLNLVRKVLLAIDDIHMRMKHLFSNLYSVDTRNIGPRDMFFLTRRMISLKLDPHNHPFQETLWELLLRGCVLSVTRPEPRLLRTKRWFYLWWFAAMFLAPRPLTWSLSEMLVRGREQRGWLFKKVVSLIRKIERR